MQVATKADGTAIQCILVEEVSELVDTSLNAGLILRTESKIQLLPLPFKVTEIDQIERRDVHVRHVYRAQAIVC